MQYDPSETPTTNSDDDSFDDDELIFIENAIGCTKSTAPSQDQNEDATETKALENEDEQEVAMNLVPTDPSVWDVGHIKSWLKWMTKTFSIEPPLVAIRFPKTGNELVELYKADFWVCAGSKEAGNTLAKYIAHTVHNATGKNLDHLLDESDPGMYQIISFWRCLDLLLLNYKLYMIREYLTSR